jgi:hypothetical protein
LTFGPGTYLMTDTSLICWLGRADWLSDSLTHQKIMWTDQNAPEASKYVKITYFAKTEIKTIRSGVLGKKMTLNDPSLVDQEEKLWRLGFGKGGRESCDMKKLF